MADTKSRTKPAKAKRQRAKPGSTAVGKRRTRTKPKVKAKARPATKAKAKAKAKARPAARAAKTANGKVKDAEATVEKAVKSAGESTKEAGRTIGHAVDRAKVPLLAGGAALAGVVGGAALGARQARHHSVLGRMKGDDLTKLARKAGDVGMQVGELAVEVKRAREASNGKARRSPIEVVLQGLTNRRHP